jgi:hypothetical protein
VQQDSRPGSGPVAWWRRSHNPRATIYGTVLGCGVLAAESGKHASTTAIGVYMILTVGVFWLAHAYAAVLAEPLPNDGAGRRVAIRFRDSLAEEWGMLGGTVLMLATLVVCRIVGVPLPTAISLAIWVGVAELVGWGLVAARGSGLRGRHVALYAAGAGAIGIIEILLKTLLS